MHCKIGASALALVRDWTRFQYHGVTAMVEGPVTPRNSAVSHVMPFACEAQRCHQVRSTSVSTQVVVVIGAGGTGHAIGAFFAGLRPGC